MDEKWFHKQKKYKYIKIEKLGNVKLKRRYKLGELIKIKPKMIKLSMFYFLYFFSPIAEHLIFYPD